MSEDNQIQKGFSLSEEQDSRDSRSGVARLSYQLVIGMRDQLTAQRGASQQLTQLSADTYAISTADRRERPWAAKDPARDHRSEDECAEHPSLGWIIHIQFSKFTFGGSGSAAGKLIFGSGRGNLYGRKMNVWCQVQELWLSLELSWTKRSGKLTRSSLSVLI